VPYIQGGFSSEGAALHQVTETGDDITDGMRLERAAKVSLEIVLI
jgi:hypothetical protein